MKAEEQRRALEALIAGGDTSLAALSHMLRRNAAWLQQYLKRGTPKLLPEEERGRLARFFGVDESVLGGPAARVVRVARLDVAASAGPGGLVDGSEWVDSVGYSADELRRLGIAPADASLIRVSGRSMEPALHDGDRILVDRGQRRPGAKSAIWVIRRGDLLLVKRLEKVREGWRIVSDNPEWKAEVVGTREVEVLGRVVQLTREF